MPYASIPILYASATAQAKAADAKFFRKGEMMLKLAVSLILAAAASWAADVQRQTETKTASGWTLVDSKDPLDGHRTLTFAVQGSYLEAPSNKLLAAPQPYLTVSCSDQRRGLIGAFSAGVIFKTDSDDHLQTSFDYRPDWQDKPESRKGTQTNNLRSVVVGSHIYDMLGWKRIKQTRTLLISAEEYLGNRVIMQFALPDRQDISAACGSVSPPKSGLGRDID